MNADLDVKMEDASPSSSGSGGISLFPADFKRIERVADGGEEFPERELTEEERFVRNVRELEEHHLKKKRKLQGKSGENGKDREGKGAGEGVEQEKEKEEQREEEEQRAEFDPRIYYRSMVASLQSGIAELNQLINVIDLIRGKEFLEEAYCIREDTIPKTKDLNLLVEAKSEQMNQVSQILSTGVESMRKSVHKERLFFKDVRKLLKRWKIEAPTHGMIPKPFRAGESLAIDCSYKGAGSSFVPLTNELREITSSELGRTKLGHVMVKWPSAYLPRTLEVFLTNTKDGTFGDFVLPGLYPIEISEEELNELTDSKEDIEKLNTYNENSLKSIQHSVFCEELFTAISSEALKPEANWTDSATSATVSSGSSSICSSDSLSVVHVLDDEVKVCVDEHHVLSIRLVRGGTVSSVENEEGNVMGENGCLVPNGVPYRTSPKKERPQTAESSNKLLSLSPSLSKLCESALIFLQNEIYAQFTRFEKPRCQVFSGASDVKNLPPSLRTNQNDQNSVRSLFETVSMLSHSIFKNQVSAYLDHLSSALVVPSYDSKMYQFRNSNSDLPTLNQPYCDSTLGIYLRSRWKKSPVGNMSAFDLLIGNSYVNEVIIRGNQVTFSAGQIAHWGPLAPSTHNTLGLKEFQEHVKLIACSQVAEMLFRDAMSIGVKRVQIDVDHLTVRIFASREWDGSSIGEGRVTKKDKDLEGCIILNPVIVQDTRVVIQCCVQALQSTSDITIHEHPDRSDLGLILWNQLPGFSDTAKLQFLLQKLHILPFTIP